MLYIVKLFNIIIILLYFPIFAFADTNCEIHKHYSKKNNKAELILFSRFSSGLQLALDSKIEAYAIKQDVVPPNPFSKPSTGVTLPVVSNTEIILGLNNNNNYYYKYKNGYIFSAGIGYLLSNKKIMFEGEGIYSSSPPGNNDHGKLFDKVRLDYNKLHFYDSSSMPMTGVKQPSYYTVNNENGVEFKALMFNAYYIKQITKEKFSGYIGVGIGRNTTKYLKILSNGSTVQLQTGIFWKASESIQCRIGIRHLQNLNNIFNNVIFNIDGEETTTERIGVSDTIDVTYNSIAKVDKILHDYKVNSIEVSAIFLM